MKELITRLLERIQEEMSNPVNVSPPRTAVAAVAALPLVTPNKAASPAAHASSAVQRLASASPTVKEQAEVLATPAKLAVPEDIALPETPAAVGASPIETPKKSEVTSEQVSCHETLSYVERCKM
jgi:hypothetical protein